MLNAIDKRKFSACFYWFKVPANPRDEEYTLFSIDTTIFLNNNTDFSESYTVIEGKGIYSGAIKVMDNDGDFTKTTLSVTAIASAPFLIIKPSQVDPMHSMMPYKKLLLIRNWF